MKQIRRITGQSVVEFALVIPLILLLFLVFIDLGRIVYFHSALYNAVREGARYATVNQSTNTADGVSDKVKTYAVAIEPKDIIIVTITCKKMDLANPGQLIVDENNKCADFVTVHADVAIDPMAVFLAQMLGSGNKFNIAAESTMQMTPYGAYSE